MYIQNKYAEKKLKASQILSLKTICVSNHVSTNLQLSTVMCRLWPLALHFK